MSRIAIGLLVMVMASTTPCLAADDVLYADFEGADYGVWMATGEAFGMGPAQGTLPGQMPVSGFRGKGLVNSFKNGDGTTGRLTSPEFAIRHKSITFLIGGGAHDDQTCINLVVAGEVIRTAAGPNSLAGGSEMLEPAGWDVTDLLGKTAKLEIVDTATSGWGHINIDHIVFTDDKPPPTAGPAMRDVPLTERYLLFPVKNGGKVRKVTVTIGGRRERWFDIELADGPADWWAPLDVALWKGETARVHVDKMPTDSQALASIAVAPTVRGFETLYREPLRPQLRFSPRRGWTNDPNGMVCVNGEYHLFFQHNPYGWNWGNMHWGHAVSRDLVHWQEVDEALYPDAMGPMFSGSAVIDHSNTSGFGQNGVPPVVLFYTAAGNPTVQGMAYSTDQGKTFTKYAKNPIVSQITGGNRDPKVLWHEPTKKWVMTLYVELPGPLQDGKRTPNHTIHFLTSSNLKDWQIVSRVDGLFECPDFFELPVDGNPANKKWVLTAASSEYMVGRFDGVTFTPETPKLPGHRGRGFYAAQTFSDIPAADGRRIQIGWLQAPSPGMPFNQAMSLPLELQLKQTAEGPRMTWTPVKELQTLRQRVVDLGAKTFSPGDANPLENAAVELLELSAVMRPQSGSIATFLLRGVSVVYDAAQQELIVNGHRTPAKMRDGRLDLRIFVDRTNVEVFAAQGMTYIPFPVIPAAEDLKASLSVQGGDVVFESLTLAEIRSIWERSSLD